MVNKYAGRTFERLLDGCRNSNCEIAQYCGWIIQKYSKNISTTPKSQATDLAAYLLRSGWDPDQRAASLSYTRTYQDVSVSYDGCWSLGFGSELTMERCLTVRGDATLVWRLRQISSLWVLAF